MKRITALFILVILAMSSCRPANYTSGVQETESLKIGVLVYSGNDPYVMSVRDNIKTLSIAYPNAEVIYYDAKSDQGLQFEQVDELIKSGVDCLAINLVDIGSFKRMAEKLLEADMPAVFFNREPDLVLMKSYKNLFFVGTNVNEAGILQGEMIVDVWENSDVDKNGDGILQYILLKGEIDHVDSIARSSMALQHLRDANIEVEELLSHACNWDKQAARDLMLENSALLEKAEAIISNNDSMAIGTLEAMEGLNLPVIPIFGVDAIQEAVALIHEGKIAGTVKQDSMAMAKNVLKMCVNGGTNLEFLHDIDINPDESGVAIRIPYQSYTK